MRLQGTFPNYRLMSCISSNSRCYLTLTLAATCGFQLWHAYGTQMFGRHLLLLNLAILLPVKRWILPLERARSFFWAVACFNTRGRWRHGFWDRFGSQVPVVFWAYKVGVHLDIVIHSWYIYICTHYIHITIYNIHRDIVIIFTYYSMQLSQSQYPDTLLRPTA